MMRNNPMRQGRYTPIVTQGEITGKAFPDYDELQERRANAKHTDTRVRSYPMSSEDDLSIVTGELVFGLRERRCAFMATGEPNEMGLSSLAGLDYTAYGSDEAAMRDYYLLGVAKATWRADDEAALDHGFAFLRAGSISVINNGPGTIFAGDLVCWRNPPTERSPGGNGRPMPTVVYQNTSGTPNTKYMRELVRFDYTDYTSQVAGAFSAMLNSSVSPDGKQHGVADLPFERLNERVGCNDARALSSLQEEAMAFKYALTGIVLRGIESLMTSGVIRNVILANGAGFSGENAARDLGLWSPDPRDQGRLHQLMADLMLGHTDPTLAQTEEANRRADVRGLNTNGGTSPAERYGRLSHSLMSVLLGGISGAWYAKASRVVGKSMSTSNPSETLDLMVGHFRPGI